MDIEKWAHEVAVPEFEIDAQPVQWSQYIEFVDEGGYDREELWLADGWRWLLWEVAAMIVFGLLSMGLDRLRRLQKERAAVTIPPSQQPPPST